MNIPHLNIIRRLWNQKSGVAQRRLALKKEKIEEANMETHRVSVTVTDPNHTMSTMRKEKIQKRVRVQARDKQHAIDSAIHHYKKSGYKVHDHNYIGKVNEEVELEEGLGHLIAKGINALHKPNQKKPPLPSSNDRRKLEVPKTEEVAANNVGDGNIAGTQGDAGKKPVMNKKPLKRFKDLMDK